MILEKKYNSLESILLTLNKDIIISLNTNGIYAYPPCGYNDLNSQFEVKDAVKSFTGLLVKVNILPELRKTGIKKLGDIVKIENNEHTYWGIVCYDLNDKLRSKSPISIEQCLNKIATETKAPASFYIGKEIMNKQENDSSLILEAVQKSDAKVLVYL
ncbi:MAG: hypothetical protein NTW62_01560 [Candidatus Nomurabacteria bacterium]|nr:hypothetical protein [Candidatus Nomurabacteria bacterium]